ncbi:MAG: LptF/LptG family permease, partial [Rhodospirillales bacterium]|nr:LptF/LptG family permease [Rhodospirillales bacterium]
MRLSSTLSVYIGRQFLWNFIGLLAIILTIVLLFDVIELLRRTHSRPNITFMIILKLALLKLPYMTQQVFPFATLFGGMLTFWRLARHQELVVTRSAGISAWQFLLPVIAVGFLLGVFQMTALNPLASTTLTHYERAEVQLFKGGRSKLEISKTGVWLRQSNPQGQAVIRATRIITEGQSISLYDITVFLFKGTDQFHKRFDAKSASLEDGFWHIKDAWVQIPE